MKTWSVEGTGFTGKALIDETFFGIRQTGAHPLSELMLVSFILSSCVKQWRLVCTKDENQIRKLANLNLVKARRGVLKTMSCHTFSESDHSVKWKVYTAVTQEKLMHAVFMVIVDTATLCLKLWDAFINFAHVKKLVFLSLRKIFDEALERES